MITQLSNAGHLWAFLHTIKLLIINETLQVGNHKLLFYFISFTKINKLSEIIT